MSTRALPPLRRTVLVVAALTALALGVPLLAMRVTDAVAWSVFDFVAAAALLFGAGFGYAVLLRAGEGFAYRAAAGLAVLAVLLLCWANLAVGLIGAEDHPANLLYLALPALGGIGAVMSRRRASGMARTLLAMALAQAAIGALAISAGWGLPWSGTTEIGAITAVFVLLFLASAALFARAAQAARTTRRC